MTQSIQNKRIGGRRAPSRKDALAFGDFLTVVPAHPLAVDDTTGVTFALDHNDEYGDCVATGMDNLRRAVTKLLTGVEKDATWGEVVFWYKTQNPTFNEVDPGGPGDQGMDMQTFLSWLQKQGLIVGFAKVDPTNDDEMQAALYLFLVVYCGAVLQVAQQHQVTTWDYVPGSPDWGGHCFIAAAYGPDGRDGVISWNQLFQTTPTWRHQRMDEAWVVLLPEHIAHAGFRAGFDLPKFAAAFTAITNRPFPVAVPPVTPPPGPGATFPGALVAAAAALGADPAVTAFLTAHSGKRGALGEVATRIGAVLAAPRA